MRIEQLVVIYTFVGGVLITGVSNHNVKCGLDLAARVGHVHEGRDHVSMYPWIGFMYYDDPSITIYTIPVVLIAKQMVLGSASDLDKYPKIDIRKRSRVVLGSDCKGVGIPIKQYTFHADYNTRTYSSLALIQLDTSHVEQPLYPICPPPKQVHDPTKIYAISLPQDCTSPYIRVYKMELVDLSQCQIFYRRSGLDMKKMWPTYTTCAQAVSGGKCVWSSGAVLVLKQGSTWRLLGYGVAGPGCGAAARFLDYGRYRAWVRRSLRSVGQPAVTRLAPDYLVLRRSMSNVQRYGPCEPEEVKTEIYSDRTTVKPPQIELYMERSVRYNLTIFANIEYSCVVMRLFYNLKFEKQRAVTPKIFLRRWCVTPEPMCYDAQLLQIDFYVEIYFQQTIHYHIYVYGKEIKFIDTKKLLGYVNRKLDDSTNAKPAT